MDPDSDEDDGDDQPDVKDPHIGFDQRRRDMEMEMDEDERRDLRGGWEDFVKSEPGEPGPSRPIKRSLDEDTSPTGPNKRSLEKDTSSSRLNKTTTLEKPKPNFGSDMIAKERLKGLGMQQTTLTKTSNTVGYRQEISADKVADAKPTVLSASQWECKLCTYVNIADHGRCGLLIPSGKVAVVANSSRNMRSST